MRGTPPGGGGGAWRSASLNGCRTCSEGHPGSEGRGALQMQAGGLAAAGGAGVRSMGSECSSFFTRTGHVLPCRWDESEIDRRLDRYMVSRAHARRRALAWGLFEAQGAVGAVWGTCFSMAPPGAPWWGCLPHPVLINMLPCPPPLADGRLAQHSQAGRGQQAGVQSFGGGRGCLRCVQQDAQQWR